MRNVNIISVPGEASVNFATLINSPPTITGSKVVTGLSSNAISFTGITGLENGMAIYFSSVGGLTGVSINTTYWVQSASGSPTTSIKLYSDYNMSSAVSIGGAASGSPTFIIYNIGNLNGSTAAPQDFTYDADDSAYFMLDGRGQTWSNLKTTSINHYWTFTGVTGTSDTSAGNGITYYKASDSTRWVFVWNDQSIDYFDLVTLTWTWGWKPSTGGTHQANYLKKNGGSHEAFVAPDSRVYYCDGTYIGRFYQTDPAVPFIPTNTATYTFDQTNLLPVTDSAQSLTFLGTSIMIGGINNIIYPWDRFDSNFSFPILLPEYNIVRMVTVNTNTYIFVGNRGRIYITNGTNVQLYKKIPDHISGTVEPYFKWGGATSIKNQLFFSALVTTNAGSAVNQYGGVWAIDLDTKAIRLTNQLSYGTYAGYSSAMIPNFSLNPAGTGLYIGWDDNAFHYGIDTTSTSPYTGSQASIDSDLIPIGTYTHTRDMTNIEYRLTKPMVAGESIVIKTRLIFNTEDTGYTSTFTDSTIGHWSNKGDINFINAQWVQFQIVLNSTASSPSYTRLKEIRILGLTGPTPASSQQISL